MSDGLAIRRGGRRRAPSERRKTPVELVGPSIGLSSSGRPGEFRINTTQMQALEQLYTSHPAIAAARGILHGQLLKGGLTVRRDGKNVELTPAFAAHLDEVWLGFAADVIDAFLKWGAVVVVYEEDDESLSGQLAKRQRSARGEQGTNNLYPMVPPRETYDLAFVQGGRAGYKRQYLVYNQSPAHAAKVDEEARVFVREHPDAAGNVVSPMSKVMDLGSFVTALTELALQAELTNARPRLWTQQRQKKDGNALDPSTLFFDAASREVQASQDAHANRQQVDTLAMQQQMCAMLNELQHRRAPQQEQGRGSFTGQNAVKQTHLPPEVRLRRNCACLFLLPCLLTPCSIFRCRQRSLRCPPTRRWRTRRVSSRRRGATSKACSASPSSSSRRPLVCPRISCSAAGERRLFLPA